MTSATHELRPIFDACGTASGELVDFAFISDANFLLVVALTAKGNILTYHRSNHHQQSCQCVSLLEVYGEFVEAALITIAPDASTVFVVLTNGHLLLLPIRLLMKATWGDPTNTSAVEFAVDSNVDVALRLPTSAVCFNSLHTGRTFVVFANKGGCVNVVDVELRRLLVSLQTNEPIRELEVFSAPDSLDLWLLVTHTSGQQSLMRIESEEMPLRENMAHTIPDDILHVNERITGINADNTLTSYSAEKNTLSVLENLAERTELAQFPVPAGCSRTFFASRLLACATEDSSVQTCLPFIKSDRFQPAALPDDPDRLQMSVDDGRSKVLGFVPVARTFDLDQCLAVCTSGLFMLTPITPLSVLTINQLIQTNFSAPPFLDICECTKKEPFAFFESIFREVVRSKATNCVELIDGLVSLAFELGFELRKLSALTNELGQHDALIPYLSVRGEKEQQDSGVRQLLFETFTHKLWKLEPHSAQKEQLEREICQFLVKYESRPEVIDVLLKHSLLSCSIVLLQRNRAAVTPQVAAFLVEQPKWSSFDPMDVLRLVGGLQWSLLEGTTKKLLYRKLMHFAGSEIHRPPHQWASLMSVAAQELRAEHTTAAPFFVFVCLGVLHRTGALPLAPTPLHWNPLGFGSNCALIVGDDRRLWAWGEFKAGNVRTRAADANKTAGEGMKKSDSRKRLRDPSNSTADGGDQLPLFGLTKTPQELPVPPELADDPLGFTSVVCGTEHALLLTSSGRLFAYGKNRYGQCGVGHANPVTRLTEVAGSFARPRSIHAGHYHSCVIDENNDVFLWGWAVHGQLAMETIKNVHTPTKVDSLSQLDIQSAALGMAHSLFLDRRGAIFGCGFMDNGELLVDPQKMPECGGQTKTWRLIRIEMPEPIELLSSNYFMSVALSKTAVYEWGISPHALKLNAFWQKRQNAKTRAEMKADGEAEANALQPPVNPNDPTATPMRTSMSRDHFKLRRVCSWDSVEQPVQEISVGYNHASILSANGQLYCWGRSLDRQLGFGTKADKATPTLLVEPAGVVWSHVRCGRNSTIAVGERGETFVWGRNDRNQLGVPPSLVSPTQQPAESPKRYVLKSGASNKKRAIELPVSHAVDRPTVIADVHCGVHQKWLLESDLEEQLNVLVDSCDQSVLHAVGEQLRSTPICSPLAIRVQLLAGDLLHALDALARLYAANRARIQAEMSELRRAQTATPKPAVELNCNTLQPPTSVADESKNGNFAPPAASALSPPPQPTNAADSTVGSVDVEEFERLIDAAWSLLNAHPVEDVRTVAALTMLCAHFPCINRLAADARLCRLVAAYVELPQTNLLTSSSTVNRKAAISSAANSPRSDSLSASFDFCTSATSNRQRMSELKSAKERAAALRRARCPGPSKVAALRQRADQLAGRLDYFASCGHFERRVVDATARRAQLHRQRNSLRRCSNCVPKVVAPLAVNMGRL